MCGQPLKVTSLLQFFSTGSGIGQVRQEAQQIHQQIQRQVQQDKASFQCL